MNGVWLCSNKIYYKNRWWDERFAHRLSCADCVESLHFIPELHYLAHVKEGKRDGLEYFQ